jgi:hypothetical protein
MKHILRAAGLVLVLAVATARAQTAAKPWRCDNRPEADALKQAPLGATRPAKDELVVAWAKGSLVFRDSGVVAGDEGGTIYHYCGFRSGFHLIRKAEDELYWGVLVAHSSGKILPAGYEVWMAPSHTRYLAVSQPHGQDGETWAVYSTTGSILWKGYAGLVGSVGNLGGMVLGELKDPRWSPEGRLSATFMCKGKPSRVFLQRYEAGWDWSPQMTCVQQPGQFR